MLCSPHPNQKTFSHFRRQHPYIRIGVLTGSTTCTPCNSLGCPVGQYRSNCGSETKGFCKPCTKSSGRYFSAPGATTNFLTDNCPTARCNLCPLGHYRNRCGEPGSQDASGVCQPCAAGRYKASYDSRSTPCTSCLAHRCPRGQYRHGCGKSTPGKCLPCSNPKLQPGRYYKGPGANIY